MQNKGSVSSTLFVENFNMFPRAIKNEFCIEFRELGATTEKYVRSKYLLKIPANSFTFYKPYSMTDAGQTSTTLMKIRHIVWGIL